RDFSGISFIGRQGNIPLEYSARVTAKRGGPPVSGQWRKEGAGPACQWLERGKGGGAGLAAAQEVFFLLLSLACTARPWDGDAPRRWGAARRPEAEGGGGGLRWGSGGDGGAGRRGSASSSCSRFARLEAARCRGSGARLRGRRPGEAVATSGGAPARHRR
uniref:Uncharacterized protein n=1 Tax=Oryza glaberrima TaxID=4538 RepID=I1PKF2_ORYGL